MQPGIAAVDVGDEVELGCIVDAPYLARSCTDVDGQLEVAHRLAELAAEVVPPILIWHHHHILAGISPPTIASSSYR